MLRILLLPLLLFSVFIAKSQNEKSHWYFGTEGSGIRFENGEPAVDNSGKANSYIGSVSMSDSSGNLLFYTNGAAFFNKDHEVMDGSKGFNSAFSKDVIAVPSPIEQGVYFVYSVDMNWIDGFIVDMKANGGLGQVETIAQLWPSDGQFVETVTGIKDCESNSYWIITLKSIASRSQLICYQVNLATGLLSQKDSYLLDQALSYPSLEMVTSPNGEYLAMISNTEAVLAHFDPRCGEFKSADVLDLPNTGAGPKGACFSPNGDYLYITTSKPKSENEGSLYQIDYKNLDAPNAYANAQKVDYALYTLLNGPDNRMYLLTQHEQDNTTSVDRIANPNASWNDINYEPRVLSMPIDGLFLPYLPNFITDTRDCSKETSPRLSGTDFCDGDSLRIQFSNTTGYDSMYLVDFELGTSYSVEAKTKVVLDSKAVGVHSYQLTWRVCQLEQKEKDIAIRVRDNPILSVSDTLICTGDTMELNPSTTDYIYEYFFKQNGQWRPQLSNLYAKGNYKTTVSNGFCTSEDSFALDLIPPLTTSLGDSFSFCEQSGTSIVLDAGKGFEGYLWHPTEDSTQWITVRKKGDYYVVVNDSRGCKGRGDAKVFSDCQPLVFIPNAFSPDGNGVNDSFYINGSYIVPQTIQVFDRWGALVHYGNGSKMAWNGTKNGVLLPMGMYFYLMTYQEEFTDKTHTLSGPIYLLR